MASIRDITTMCRAGQIQEAYDFAKADLEQQLSWAQQEVGWALYYMIKTDADTGDYQSLLSHLDELNTLNKLVIPDDNMIFENVLFKVAMYVKSYVTPTGIDSPAKLSSLFSRLRQYNFDSSKGYSFLLQSFIKCDAWQEMADFIDWWNLDKLISADYTPYRMDNGRTIISVAERAFIANSKALLRLNDFGRIEEFLPKLDNLMNSHPEMTYPGFFYGKLLLSLGNTQEEALKVIVPFARRKATEFWVWQLLSEVFVNEPDKQLACLLRAVHCRTQENFLGKVRIRLATLYIQSNLLGHAKFQIDKVTQCYLSQGWHLPYEVDCWIHQPWINTISSCEQAPIDYKAITDEILCKGTEESIVIVTYVDANSHKATLIYGREKRMTQKLRFKVGTGVVLKINYITEPDGKLRILNAGQTCFLSDLDYAKIVEGTVKKRTDKDFAFLKTTNGDFYISPQLVRKYNLQNNEVVRSLVVYDYNRRKENWDWTCVSINKKNN